MHTVIARWFVKPGQEEAADAALARLVDEVKAGEPGTLDYLVHKGAPTSLPPTAATEIVFVEVYEDEAAFLKHIKGPVFTGFLRDHGDLFEQNFPPNAGPYMATSTLERINGFVRETC